MSKMIRKYISGILIFGILISEMSAFASETSYDGRKKGYITPVRDQGNTSLCWAYASVNAAEAYLMKYKIAEGRTANSSILSPTQVGYAYHNRGQDPLGNTAAVSTGKNYLTEKGNPSYACALFSQWCGPVGENLSDNCNGWENSAYRLLSAEKIKADNSDTNIIERQKIKEGIKKFGAVTFSYNDLRECYYYNPSNETSVNSYPHACTVIGWDDNIPKESFEPGGATQNGGWLIKNSYSSMPYFYLSYDNSSTYIYAFSFAGKERFDYNYFYDSDTVDFYAAAFRKPKSAAVIFEAKKGSEQKKEYITAVNVGIEGENTSIRIKAYNNLTNIKNPESGDLYCEEVFNIDNSGYGTFELSNPMPVENGSLFSIVAEIENSPNSYFKLTEDSGQAFIKNFGSWSSEAGTPRVKAYSKLIGEKITFLDNKVILTPNENENGKFILSSYDGECLEKIKIFDADNNAKVFDIPIEWDKNKGTKLKGFFWKSFEDMRPIFVKEKIFK